jgi:hypothetical protein
MPPCTPAHAAPGVCPAQGGRRSDGRKAGEQGLKCRRKGRLRPPRLAGDAHIRPAAVITRQPLSWLHLSRRDLLRQSPKHDVTKRGTFAIRSPLRPNPIGTGIVTFIGREGPVLAVRGLDCLDGTPLRDLQAARDGFLPPAHQRQAMPREDDRASPFLIPDDRLRAMLRAVRRNRLAPGEACTVSLLREALHLMPKQGGA